MSATGSTQRGHNWKVYPAQRRSFVDPSMQSAWKRTGYKFFPYAALQDGQWWVLRLNFDFPEHNMYTVFIDGVAAGDVTGRYIHSIPLCASVGVLKPFDPAADEPSLSSELAETVVRAVAAYVVYGSEANEPCVWCERLADDDPMIRRG